MASRLCRSQRRLVVMAIFYIASMTMVSVFPADGQPQQWQVQPRKLHEENRGNHEHDAYDDDDDDDSLHNNNHNLESSQTDSVPASSSWKGLQGLTEDQRREFLFQWTLATAHRDAYAAASDPYNLYRHSGLFIEPDVRRHPGVLPKEVCREIIRLGEAAGFPLEFDSIDANEDDANNTKSQAIDVMDEDGTVNHPEIFAQLEPYLPAIADLIRSQRDETLDRKVFPDQEPNRMPQLGWIFYRKYSPGSARNSLVPHYDTNMHTVNIALNDDFEGGGVFVVKPPLDLNPDWVPGLRREDPEPYFFRGDGGSDIPEIHPFQYEYSWTNSLGRANSTGVLFPALQTGDALIHNYTVWHAVAPLQKGTRYSMVLFFDMDNPMLPEDDDEDEMEITIAHNLYRCDPQTNRRVPGPRVDVYFVDTEDHTLSRLTQRLRPGQIDEHTTYPGHVFWAVASSSRQRPALTSTREVPASDILATVVVRDHRTRYEFAGSVRTQADCDDRRASEEPDL